MNRYFTEGRIALITGGSRGIGAAAALELAACGCDILINYVEDPVRDNANEAQEVARAVTAMGRRAWCLAADVSDYAAVLAMRDEALEQAGQIDILVNNAGIIRDRTLRKLSPEDWNAVLSVNLTGVFHCCKAVVEHMQEQQYGRIVSIASVVGLMGNIGQSNYAAAKAGIIGFTKSLARETARKGITANAVAPGFIATEMTAGLSPEVTEAVLGNIPAGSMGQPQDVARAVAFLASDAASYIFGQVLFVNGGMYM